jgi:hypothetical protein
MAIVQNGTNKYIDHPIIVDAAGSTPFTTVASGITAAVGLGLAAPTTVFIKSGTYTEDLTLVSGINLEGENEHTVIIDGAHTVPAAGTFKASHIKFAQTTPATNVFVEGGAGTCAIDIEHCIFYIDSGMAFNLVTSTGPIAIDNCSDISPANSIIDNTTGASAVTIKNSVLGSGAVAAAIGGTTTIISSHLHCSLDFQGTATSYVRNCSVTSDSVNEPQVSTNDTTTVYLSDSTINSGTAATLNVVDAGSTVYVCNCGLISTVAGGNLVIGAGTVQFDEATFWTAKGITVATPTYDSRVVTGSLQLDPTTTVGALYGTAGVVTSTAAMTDGQVLIGSTGVAPVLGTLTAGAGISVTNAAGTITVASTGSAIWTAMDADATLAVNTARINTKAAALLTATLPATAAVGTTLILQGSAVGANGWKIAQNAGQNIQVGNTSTTIGAGGSIASTDEGDGVSLVCTVADTTWNAFAVVGNLTIV